MLETNNLDRERRKERDLAEPCEGDERVVMWSPFGVPPHQNKPCEQCLLGKRFATAEAVTSTICHLQIKCHTQTDTSLCPVSFCLVNTHTQAYKCKVCSLSSVCLNHTHICAYCVYLRCSGMRWSLISLIVRNIHYIWLSHNPPLPVMLPAVQPLNKQHLSSAH